MLPAISKIKGIHPGAILKRELQIRNMPAVELAQHIDEHKQTISAILNERRGITPTLSIKLSREFNVDKDYFMLLQASYEVERAEAISANPKPDLASFRKVLFWDTHIHKINWHKSKRSIIKRILERGNEKEIWAMINFYGKEIVKKEVLSMKESFLPSYKDNVSKYLN
ncbi:HigA family addiction module antitoxin [Niabella sp. CJ426]|jgi:addiction module HigA family antidote|uniref:HigA family addiction module antitoxin n=1 Tax=Niabella sp. CJ426 TaxID=3393740 RepID=UPI003D059792